MELVLEANRVLVEEALSGRDGIREPFESFQVKRRVVVRHLEQNRYEFVREGANHKNTITMEYNCTMSRRGRGSTSLLERLLDPISRSLNVEAARKLVALKADPKTQARVDELARKCNEGELTSAEESEYERYVTAGNLIAILQAKARLILTRKT